MTKTTFTYTCAGCQTKYTKMTDADDWRGTITDKDVFDEMMTELGWQVIDGETFCDLCAPGEDEKAKSESEGYRNQVRAEYRGKGRV